MNPITRKSVSKLVLHNQVSELYVKHTRNGRHLKKPENKRQMYTHFDGLVLLYRAGTPCLKSYN